MHRYLILSVLLIAGVTGLYAAEATHEPAQPEGSYINLQTEFGTTFTAYSVGDKNAENGVLLIHDKWGLDKHARQWADRFAAMGYYALAVDLFDGRHVSDTEMGDDVVHSIDPVWIDADLKSALKYLKQSQQRVVSLGWGMGGERALLLALQQPQDISAIVSYYGKPVTDDQMLDALNGPMLAIFATRDDRIDKKTIAAFNDSMKVLNKKLVELNVDADRDFDNPRSKAYSEPASNEAWDATREFLTKYLPTPPGTH